MSRKFRPFYIASVAVMGVGLLGSVVVPKAPVSNNTVEQSFQAFDEPAASIFSIPGDEFPAPELLVPGRNVLSNLMTSLPSATLADLR